MCRRVFISGLLALWMTLPVMAQHLDIDSIDGGGSLNVAGVALDTTEDLLRDDNGLSIESKMLQHLAATQNDLSMPGDLGKRPKYYIKSKLIRKSFFTPI